LRPVYQEPNHFAYLKHGLRAPQASEPNRGEANDVTSPYASEIVLDFAMRAIPDDFASRNRSPRMSENRDA
jgi:hypothetical protein